MNIIRARNNLCATLMSFLVLKCKPDNVLAFSTGRQTDKLQHVTVLFLALKNIHKMIYISILTCNFAKLNQISNHHAKTFPTNKKGKLTVYYG